jgi:glycosyltransferase involved in cell wall biosynthesis
MTSAIVSFLKVLTGRNRIIRLKASKTAGEPRRALLLYLNDRWNPVEYLRKKSSHQNLHQAQDIASILQERGFSCDVVHYKNRKFAVTTPYDVIISHRMDDGFLQSPKPAGSRYLALTTTQAPQVHNRISRHREQEVCAKRGGTLSNLRDVGEDLSFLRHADSIAAFGDGQVAEGWQHNFTGPIRTFQNWWFDIPRPKEKNWAEAKTGFLFLASGSQVHKGLDLVLEAAQRLPQARVYVCSYFESEKDFCALYRRELFESPNVFPIGWTNIHSAKFQQLLAGTAFAILPSASDACPGSIVQAAHCGLIPVLSQWCGVSWPEARFADALTVDAVRVAMEQCLAMSAEEVETLSTAVQQRVDRECSREAFRRRWEEILDEIVGPVVSMPS